MRNIVLFSGSSHPKLGQAVAQKLGIPLGAVNLSHFSNKETSVQVLESVRDLDVFIIQVVIPCFPYARQPDVPYKRNGLPKRVNLDEVMSNPAAKELAQQRERRVEEKLSKLNIKDKDSVIFGSVASGGLSSDSETESDMEQHSPERDSSSLSHETNASSLRIDKKFPNVEVSSKMSEQMEKQTLIASPINPIVTPLGLPNSGNYKHWTARSGTLVANMIMAAGASHIITMDLHDPQFQGFFDIPVDNLYGSPLFVKYIREKIPNYKQAVIVSPDAGGAKRASTIAHKLGMSFALVHKDRKLQPSQFTPSSTNMAVGEQEESCINSPLLTRPHPSHSTSPIGTKSHFRMDNMMLVGNIKDKICILIDDIADTSRTLTRASKILHANGAKTIYAIVTHGILSGDAAVRIKESNIDYLVVSNSVPQDMAVKILGERIRVFDVAGILAEAIRRVHHGESVSYLFEPVDI